MKVAIGVFVALAVLALIWSQAFGHGALSWAAEYKSSGGTPCCTGPSEHGQGDCTEVPEAVAMLVRLGGTVPVQFLSGERLVRINKIFTSPDPNAPWVVCATGCAFTGAGV